MHTSNEHVVSLTLKRELSLIVRSGSRQPMVDFRHAGGQSAPKYLTVALTCTTSVHSCTHVVI